MYMYISVNMCPCSAALQMESPLCAVSNSHADATIILLGTPHHLSPSLPPLFVLDIRRGYLSIYIYIYMYIPVCEQKPQVRKAIPAVENWLSPEGVRWHLSCFGNTFLHAVTTFLVIMDSDWLFCIYFTVVHSLLAIMLSL